jgi:hypothetical protein
MSVQTYGYRDFFHELAQNMINDPELAMLGNNLITLNSYDDLDYGFDAVKPNKSAHDLPIIFLAIRCVLEFDALVYRALETMANSLSKSAPSPRDSLSFASKFIHFHAPHSVFILDGITEKRLAGFHAKEFRGIKRKAIGMGDGKSLEDDSSLGSYPFVSKDLDRYVTHYLRCYEVGKNLKNGKRGAAPRQVDIVLICCPPSMWSSPKTFSTLSDEVLAIADH